MYVFTIDFRNCMCADPSHLLGEFDRTFEQLAVNFPVGCAVN